MRRHAGPEKRRRASLASPCLPFSAPLCLRVFLHPGCYGTPRQFSTVCGGPCVTRQRGVEFIELTVERLVLLRRERQSAETDSVEEGGDPGRQRRQVADRGLQVRFGGRGEFPRRLRRLRAQ